METHWVFNNATAAEKRAAQQVWAKHAKRLERVLQRYRSDLRHLRLTMDRLARKGLWEVRAVLELPTGVLVAEERGKVLQEALDKAADTLIRDVRRHNGQIRRDYLYRRQRRRRQQLESAIPMLERDAQRGRSQAFFDLLKPLIPAVRDHARRELHLLELEGALPQGEWTADDLVDDVMARAWDRFADRPEHQPLDVWLLALLRERLDELKTERRATLLSERPSEGERAEDEALTPEEDMEENDYWLERLFGLPSDLSLEDLIPDREPAAEWEALSDEEQRRRLDDALGRLPPLQRQALLLHVGEGYDLDEVAMIQNRSVRDVQEDLETARARLAELVGARESVHAR